MGKIYTKGLNWKDSLGSTFLVQCFTDKSDYSAVLQPYNYKSISFVDGQGNIRHIPVCNGGLKDNVYSLIAVDAEGVGYYPVHLKTRLYVSGNMTGQGVTDSQSGTTTVNITGIQTREYWTGRSGIKINTPIEVRIQGMYRTSVRVNSSIYTFPANTTQVSSSSLRSVGISTAYTIRIAVHNTETDTWYYSNNITRGKNWGTYVELEGYM